MTTREIVDELIKDFFRCIATFLKLKDMETKVIGIFKPPADVEFILIFHNNRITEKNQTK